MMIRKLLPLTRRCQMTSPVVADGIRSYSQSSNQKGEPLKSEIRPMFNDSQLAVLKVLSKVRPSLVSLTVPRVDCGGYRQKTVSAGIIVGSDCKTILTYPEFLAPDEELYPYKVPSTKGRKHTVIVTLKSGSQVYAVPVLIEPEFALLKMITPDDSLPRAAKIGSSSKLREGDLLCSTGLYPIIPGPGERSKPGKQLSAQTCRVRGNGAADCKNHLHIDTGVEDRPLKDFLINLDGELVGLNTMKRCPTVEQRGQDVIGLPIDPFTDVILAEHKIDNWVRVV